MKHRNRKYRLISKVFLVASIIILSFNQFTVAENLKKIVDLQGSWKFSIGDDLDWAQPDYDDRFWENVRVPKSWESNGFANYDGYAWYRKTFNLPITIDQEYIFLVAGYIDDVDEIYVNGHLVGATGIFPPLVRTAYDILRKYPVPVDILNQNGKNVIAVRVFDDYIDGGITGGEVGLFVDTDEELLLLNLSGYWNFETLNNFEPTTKLNPEQQSGKVFVPSFWESQGYSEFDGTATYTLDFKFPAHIDDNDLMLVLGYIDDIDKVYLNDDKIGSVEMLKKKNDGYLPHQVFRGYHIPNGLLKPGESNNIRVKVYDTGGLGGIYNGPIGITSESNFKKLSNRQEELPVNTWDEIWKAIFE